MNALRQRINEIATVILFVGLLVGYVFLVGLKLAGKVDLSWYFILFPFWGAGAMTLLMVIVAAFVFVSRGSR